MDPNSSLFLDKPSVPPIFIAILQRMIDHYPSFATLQPGEISEVHFGEISRCHEHGVSVSRKIGQSFYGGRDRETVYAVCDGDQLILDLRSCDLGECFQIRDCSQLLKSKACEDSEHGQNVTFAGIFWPLIPPQNGNMKAEFEAYNVEQNSIYEQFCAYYFEKYGMDYI